MAKASKMKLKTNTGGESVPRKKAKSSNAPMSVICELCRIAAFYSQVYIFMKVEKIKADIPFALIEEHYYGNVLKRIKGACAQLIEGEGAFSTLYNVTESEYTRELVLKSSCCGKDTSSSYGAGFHFTLEDLVTFGVKKRVKGCQTWALGLTVMHSIKKALLMVPKLSPLIVIIDKNWAVLLYASGKNESSFMKLIDNGMYALMLSKGKMQLLMVLGLTMTMRYSVLHQWMVCS
jgi:hypothetical protein